MILLIIMDQNEFELNVCEYTIVKVLASLKISMDSDRMYVNRPLSL